MAENEECEDGPNERIKKLVEVYKPFLRKGLRCFHLVPYMPCMRGSAAKIAKLDREGAYGEAVDLFFECLEKSDDQAPFATFRDALEEGGYSHIADVMKGKGVVENHYENCTLIQEIFAPALTEEIDVNIILPELRRYQLLHSNDEETIRNVARDHCSSHAVFLLLNLVPGRQRDWYEKLMKVLNHCYPRLAEEVDPKISVRENECKGDPEDYETLEQPRLTVFGEAYKADGNLGGHNESTTEKGSTESMEKEVLEKENLEDPHPQITDSMQTAKDQLNHVGSSMSGTVDPVMTTIYQRTGTASGNVGPGPQVAVHNSTVEDPNSVGREASTTRKKLFCDEASSSSSARPETVGVQNDLSAAPRLTGAATSPGIKEILTGLGNLNVPGSDKASTKGSEGGKDLLPNISASCQQGDEDEAPVKAITLRPYQDELARTALKGTNTIVCAPTGSGKTYVSTKIMLEHLKKPGVRKIIFFANQVALVNQQFKVIKDFMPRDYRIRELSGDTEEALKVPLKDLLSRNDILVMTPQILVDALRDKEVSSLSEFTLLVFDECHHTNSRHPYNRIMFSYIDRKLDESIEEDRKSLPQIVGLTASVGVGKARNIQGAVEHIQKLCANLDAGGGVSTVRDHEEDLAKHARTVGMDVKKTARRKQDVFKALVSDTLMNNVERMMLDPNYVGRVSGRPRFMESLKPPVERGGDQYTIWVSTLKREVAHIEDQQVRRFFFSCRRMLELYNKSLAINEDCRTKDAVVYLERELDKLYSSGVVMDDTDRELRDQFERIKSRLVDASKNPNCINPKLTSLAEMITGAFSKQRESRCMVFVKTRDLAMALKQWMAEDPDLSHLKPGIFTGQQASSDRGGMTRNQQLDVAELFRQGNHKVIIATSVAEEGMDFSQCNLVIKYEYVTNEIAMVQAKGRARAADSQFVVLTGNQKGTAEKEELNLIRESMMNRALVKLQEKIQENPAQFRAELLAIQKAAKAERDHEARNRKGRVLSDDEFEIRCMKCNELACFSVDIKTLKETNHVILDPEFESKVNATPHPRPGKMGFEMEKSKKIACKKCGQDWGIGVIYKNMVFAVIKIESFVAIDSMGRRDSPRKWKNAPFRVHEITDDEMTDYKSLDI